MNGVRAITKKGFIEDMQKMNPDILCLQETKPTVDQTMDALSDFKDYMIYGNEAEKKGYSGTAILTKQVPLSVSYDIGIEEHDKEGRVIALEYADFVLVNVYVPNSGSDLRRLDYRQEWDKSFLAFLKGHE